MGNGTLRKTKLTGRTDWGTPEWIIAIARAVMGGIDLDPASSARHNERVRATRYFSEEDDGLMKPWSGRVFLNPPYARGIMKEFVDKAAKEIFLTNVDQMVVLTNNDTDTYWCKTLFDNMAQVCFLMGRLAFLNEEGEPVEGNMQGQCLWYYGTNVKAFYLLTHSVKGTTVRLPSMYW